VAFTSWASNLVAGDTNNLNDVFIRDRKTGITRRVSLSSSGAQSDGFTGESSISANGRYVAFPADATTLTPDDTNGRVTDVFVRDMRAAMTRRVSVSSSGVQGNENSAYPAISADGRYVAFFSFASTLVPGDTNQSPDVFLRDRKTGTTRRASVSSDGAEANGGSAALALSADGRHLAFESWASNLVTGDTNGYTDMFVHTFPRHR
jgi:Tol biopolymer transport system component